MPRQSRRVPIGPLMGMNSQRITDRALGGTFMRGGAYNVECMDGEWWTRKGEEVLATRLGSTIWRWIFDVDRDTNMTIICNEYYALLWSRSTTPRVAAARHSRTAARRRRSLHTSRSLGS